MPFYRPFTPLLGWNTIYFGILILEDIFGKKLATKNRKPVCYKQMEENYILEKFSEGQVSKWKRLGLNVFWIGTVSNQIRIDDKTPHKAIVYEPGEITCYNRLKDIWMNSASDMIKEEKEIYEILGEFEGTRRINSFRHQLYHHVLARNAQKFNSALGRHLGHQIQWLRLINHFNISNDPRKIGGQLLFKSKWVNRGLTEKDLSQFAALAIRSVYGKSEAIRRLKLNSYMANVPYPPHWWPEDFSKDCSQYGLDPLTILKVGDALQFGSRTLIPNAPRTVPIDEAFVQVLQIMTDQERLLPWRASPERYWFLRVYGTTYTGRLKELSESILLSDDKDIPLSIDAVKRITKTRELLPNYRVGFELAVKFPEIARTA
ncbi:hypothetical protein VP01_2686g2 [Puccinia sorghi]|uniref:Uncharacterized protein n=1 Tax=Puccinia sorghi TaxID=27349 RepID=A0A0L6V3X6_9BASI|nr:hypothetical protein VP01_2686g2 [Puccinia sorghi]